MNDKALVIFRMREAVEINKATVAKLTENVRQLERMIAYLEDKEGTRDVPLPFPNN